MADGAWQRCNPRVFGALHNYHITVSILLYLFQTLYKLTNGYAYYFLLRDLLMSLVEVNQASISLVVSFTSLAN